LKNFKESLEARDLFRPVKIALFRYGVTTRKGLDTVLIKIIIV